MTPQIPQYHAFFNPTLKALRSLGGSASVQELDDKVVETLGFGEAILAVMHDTEAGNETEVEYRLAWARTYLKKFGLIDNSTRGVWSLTEKADGLDEVDAEQVVRFVRDTTKKPKGPGKQSKTEILKAENEAEIEPSWKSELHQLLTKLLDPSAFERLVQRVLRESGFIQVEVTGRTGDGGIDGKGIARIHGFMSFHVIFQCKRYKGVVAAHEVRDFRGAMVGRADKGLFITTGSFTKDAVKEATRDGAPPIDLIDGDALAEKLRELKLGVKVELVEKVIVDPHFFTAI